MPNETSFSANTAGAHVAGTLRDNLPINPNVPPMGLQAIGARVTLAFKGLWDADASYMYYDVVHDAQGASYIGKARSIPAGTVLTDTDYWIRWADPNAQYEELETIVSTFNARITNAESTSSSANEKADNALSASASNTEAIEAESAARAAAINDVNEESDYQKTQKRNMFGIFANGNPNALLETALTYMENNDKLFYGDGSFLMQNEAADGTFYPADINGTYDGSTVKFPMSCSSLVMACLLGVPYQGSRMVNGNITTTGNVAKLTGGKNYPYTGAPAMSEQTNGAAAKKYGSLEYTLHSWQLAEYLFDLGLLHHIDDFSQLQPGDILFYENWTQQETIPHWQSINHTDIFLGFNRSNTGASIITISGEPNGNYCQFVASPVTGTMASVLKWYFRLPNAGNAPDNIANFESPINITNNAFKTVRTKRLMKSPNAYTVIFEFDKAVNDYGTLHFNVFGINEAGTTQQATPGNFYIGQAYNQIAPNKYACIIRNITGTEFNGITFNQVETTATDYNITNIQIFDGIVPF